MAIRWEMCQVGHDKVTYCSPVKGTSSQSCNDFIKSKGKKIPLFEDNRYVAIALLLADGWEPYGVEAAYHHFRRQLE